MCEAAAKTNEGIQRFIAASDDLNECVDYFDVNEENDEQQTALHVVCTYYDNPEGALHLNCFV